MKRRMQTILKVGLCGGIIMSVAIFYAVHQSGTPNSDSNTVQKRDFPDPVKSNEPKHPHQKNTIYSSNRMQHNDVDKVSDTSADKSARPPLQHNRPEAEQANKKTEQKAKPATTLPETPVINDPPSQSLDNLQSRKHVQVKDREVTKNMKPSLKKEETSDIKTETTKEIPEKKEPPGKVNIISLQTAEEKTDKISVIEDIQSKPLHGDKVLSDIGNNKGGEIK